eukprot:118504-Amphidinium_carterae.1
MEVVARSPFVAENVFAGCDKSNTPPAKSRNGCLSKFALVRPSAGIHRVSSHVRLVITPSLSSSRSQALCSARFFSAVVLSACARAASKIDPASAHSRVVICAGRFGCGCSGPSRCCRACIMLVSPVATSYMI